MADYSSVFADTFAGYASYLWHEVSTPHWGNYFYWLIGISSLVYALELLAPWRVDQPRIRKDFWLDGFYMFFNYFGFSLIGYAAASQVVVVALHDLLASVGIENLAVAEVSSWPMWLHVGVLFVVRDFVHWNVHRLLHRVPVLWEFHKVHHSVEQMGFAAHLRFHWMETVTYNALTYLPLALLGFGLVEFFWVNLFTTLIGHLNHANLVLPLGPLRYVLNNPQMHIWHHVWDLPEGRRYGMNYGVTLSCWDYLFGTACIPGDGRDIRLGFPQLQHFPKTFMRQTLHDFVGQARRGAS